MKNNCKYYFISIIILFLACEQNNTIATIDCAGTIGGLFEIDDCGDCSDPYSTEWNINCTDCSGILNGLAYYDSCNQCICNPNDYPNGPPIGSLCFYPIECNDLNPNGELTFACSDGIASFNDNENFYIGADIYGNPIPGDFNTATFYTIPCILDCNGVLGGIAFTDDCDRCVSDGEHPSVDSDDDDICDGIDSDNDGQCNECTGDSQPHDECTSSNAGECVCYGNNCDECIDYNIDQCGECNGNGVDVDQDGDCDGSDSDNDGNCDKDENGLCDGDDNCLWDEFVPYADNCGECNGIIDECNICNGNGTDIDQDGLCDDVDTCTTGSGIIDICGICNGDGIPEGECCIENDCSGSGDCNGNVEDCRGVCNGEALTDDCGQCYNYWIFDNGQTWVYPSVDFDNDGLCDGTDEDDDGLCDSDAFGLCDGIDTCPLDSNNDSDNDGTCDSDDICPGSNDFLDTDGDGTADGCDACPNDANDDADNDGACGDIDQCEGFDDNIDTDADGTADGCDLCQGFDDNADADSDGNPDGCDSDDDNDGISDNEDNCPNDTNNDDDNDGVCGDIDQCEGFDDNVDADADGTADGCDLCQGFDDNADADSDGNPDGCDSDDDNDGILDNEDNCPNDTNNDDDNDGVCGDIDQCEGFDDNIDTDSDGTADGCDLCQGFDDNTDTDADGTADGCDVCPNDSDDDADSDGICGNVDQCEGFDDNADADADGTADGCDLCQGFDDNTDTDTDGTSDGCDLCEGYDDSIDTDSDSNPNGCDFDDDNDGILDVDDDCSIGDLNWTSNANTDYDTDGCQDSNEDNDNDNDGVLNDNDCDSTDENKSELDCTGLCGGDTAVDINGVCCASGTIDECNLCSDYNDFTNNTPITIYISVDEDSDGECDGIDFNNDGACDECTGDQTPHVQCTNENIGQCACYGDSCDPCIGNNFDECGICDGNGIDTDNDNLCDNLDTDGDGEIDDDCVGDNYDECGICDGIGEDSDDDGLCDNIDTDNDGNIDDSCIDADNDNICDHNDPCIDTDNDNLCDNSDEDGDGEIDDDCVGGFDQCGVCNGDGNSCLVGDGCDLENNTIYIHENSAACSDPSYTNENDCLLDQDCDNNGFYNDTCTWNHIFELWYNVDFDIDILSLSLIDNAIDFNSITGGAYTSSASSSTPISDGVLISGAPIPAGCGTLFTFEVTNSSNDVIIDDLYFQNTNNTEISIANCDTCIYEFINPCDSYPTLTTNSISLLYDGTVIYNIDYNLNQFEWAVDNVTSISSINGGESENAGFNFQIVGNILYGFSDGIPINSGCGELLNMTLNQYNDISLSDIIFKDTLDNTKNMTFIESNDCNQTIDECGVCGGSGIPNGECDCNGNTLDECGVCNGSGIADGACDCDGNIDADDDGICDTTDFDSSTMPTNSVTIDNIGNVYYNTDFVIGGFQWVVDGAVISGGTGGDAQDASFVVQGGGSTILGFSFTGSCIQNGNGKLSTMTIISGTPTSLSDIVFSDCDGIAQIVTYYTIP